mgnify:CR=1 FL=1
MRKSIGLIIFACVLSGFCSDVQAQSKRRIIQLSGFVSDSVNVLPGVHIYVPKAGRGTSTSPAGFFSMPVLEGDSVVISSIGYHRQHYIVPNAAPDNLTIVIEMVSDVTYLREVQIMPFPTEEVFKEAVLALNIPMDNGIDQKNINAELIALMLKTTPMDGAANYKYYMDQWLPTGFSPEPIHFSTRLTGPNSFAIWNRIRRIELRKGLWVHQFLLLLQPHFCETRDVAQPG